MRLESTMILNKRHHFIMCRHKVGAPMLCDEDCATGIRQADRLIPIPTMNDAVQDAGGKSITSSQNISHFNRKSGNLDLPDVTAILCQMDSRAFCAPFLHEHTRS